jgi:hypothetical protein
LSFYLKGVGWFDSGLCGGLNEVRGEAGKRELLVIACFSGCYSMGLSGVDDGVGGMRERHLGCDFGVCAGSWSGYWVPWQWGVGRQDCMYIVPQWIHMSNKPPRRFCETP